MSETRLDRKNFSVSAGCFSLSRTFAFVCSLQVFSKTSTMRVQIRHELYLVEVLPEANLTKGLEDRLMRIGNFLESNKTDAAAFETQLVVRDYGTHIVKSVVAGGALVNEDQVLDTYTKSKDESSLNIKASASSDFFVTVGFKFEYNTDKAQQDEYKKSLSQSTTRTFGGPPYRPSFKLSDWEDGLLDNLVSVDRNGVPLEFMISPRTLPHLPTPTVVKVGQKLERTLQNYMDVNTHSGCMDVYSQQFDYKVCFAMTFFNPGRVLTGLSSACCVLKVTKGPISVPKLSF